MPNMARGVDTLSSVPASTLNLLKKCFGSCLKSEGLQRGRLHGHVQMYVFILFRAPRPKNDDNDVIDKMQVPVEQRYDARNDLPFWLHFAGRFSGANMNTLRFLNKFEEYVQHILRIV